MGPVVTEAMRAGDRLRWRRRIAVTAAVVVATTVAATVPALAFHTAPRPATSVPPVAVGPTNTALIETSLHTVAAVNLTTGATRTIRVPTIGLTNFYGSTLVTAPDDTTAWVMNWTKMTPINTRTDRVGTPIPLHVRGADAAVITNGGTRAYVALSPRDILVVNLSTRKVLTRIKTPNCIYLVLSPDGKLIYASYGQGVGIISTATSTVLRTVPAESLYPFSVAPNSTTAYAFTEGFTSIVNGQQVGPFTLATRIDASTGAARKIEIRNTETADVAPDGSLLYAAGQRSLYAVSPLTGRTIRHWALPLRSASGMAVSPDGSTAYVFGLPRGRSVLGILAMVNLHTGRVERVLNFPYRPYPYPSTPVLQLSPDGRTVYVELQRSEDVFDAVAIAARSGRIIASTTVQFPGPYPVAFAR
jgi:hypothetical protein